MIKILDRMVNFIEARADITAIVQSHFPEWVPDGLVMCPFHDDTKPSLHISPEGKAKCHSGRCDFFARNIIDLFAKLEGVTYNDARWVLYGHIVRSIPDSRVEAHRKILKTKHNVLKYVRHERRVSDHIIELYELGYDLSTNRITLPIRDQFNVCVNIRKMAWRKKERENGKVISIKGHGEVRLFPENKVVGEDKVLLVEGEWDVLVGRTHGLPTATWTGGSGSWNDDYAWLFRDKIVFVLYDRDEAGEKGTGLVEDKLGKWASYVEVLPSPNIKGKDLSDWIRANSSYAHKLGDHIEGFELPKVRKVKRCPYCGQEIKSETQS